MSETGVKEYKNKTRWSLLPFDALESVVSVLNYGATTKYCKNNWKRVPHKAAYVDAIVRHWAHYFDEGEEFDPESGESHLAHLVCDALFLLWNRQDNKDIPFDEYLDKLLTYPDFVTKISEEKREAWGK